MFSLFPFKRKLQRFTSSSSSGPKQMHIESVFEKKDAFTQRSNAGRNLAIVSKRRCLCRGDA